MTILEIIKQINIGGAVGILVVLSMLVEVSKIKIYPLRWLGKHLNADMSERVDAIEKRVDAIECDSKTNTAKAYRDTIFGAVAMILAGGSFTQEQWGEWIDACDYYEAYVKVNQIPNGKATHNIKFIRHKYDEALDKADFLNLPTKEK